MRMIEISVYSYIALLIFGAFGAFMLPFKLCEWFGSKKGYLATFVILAMIGGFMALERIMLG